MKKEKRLVKVSPFKYFVVFGRGLGEEFKVLGFRNKKLALEWLVEFKGSLAYYFLAKVELAIQILE